jgi:hypothetical protein
LLSTEAGEKGSPDVTIKRLYGRPFLEAAVPPFRNLTETERSTIDSDGRVPREHRPLRRALRSQVLAKGYSYKRNDIIVDVEDRWSLVYDDTN